MAGVWILSPFDGSVSVFHDGKSVQCPDICVQSVLRKDVSGNEVQWNSVLWKDVLENDDPGNDSPGFFS